MAQPQCFVFASIKGGVGRTTALCVLAADLAAKGRRVLTIDMDLEAPGLGNMLLNEDTLPEFGLLDYLVERGLGELDDSFYADMISSSWLGGGRGKVDVLPAIGRRSFQHPANVLAKIARAYLAYGPLEEGVADAGQAGFTDHIRSLVARIADPLRYDVVLIDARAGLHETSAAAIIGLGAEVLLFGVDQLQTFAGYTLLLAHLATLPFDPCNDWRERLHFIHAKAPANENLRDMFSVKMRELAGAHLWPQKPDDEYRPALTDLQDSFDVEWDEEAATDVAAVLDNPVNAIDVVPILSSEHYHAFDPLANRDVLLEQLYREAFGPFLTLIDNLQSNPDPDETI
jgi:CobQ/CobB/MinD/ParA nucleotide binding domain